MVNQSLDLNMESLWKESKKRLANKQATNTACYGEIRSICEKMEDLSVNQSIHLAILYLSAIKLLDVQFYFRSFLKF